MVVAVQLTLGWSDTKQELFQVPLERKWKALGKHPTKENHKLQYACLEGPENSVYVRGRSSDPVIELPDYWVGLVHDDSITVNVTPIGNKNVWVESINNNSVTIGSDDSTEYFYTVFAERKDVEKLEVEVQE